MASVNDLPSEMTEYVLLLVVEDMFRTLKLPRARQRGDYVALYPKKCLHLTNCFIADMNEISHSKRCAMKRFIRDWTRLRLVCKTWNYQLWSTRKVFLKERYNQSPWLGRNIEENMALLLATVLPWKSFIRITQGCITREPFIFCEKSDNYDFSTFLKAACLSKSSGNDVLYTLLRAKKLERFRGKYPDSHLPRKFVTFKGNLITKVCDILAYLEIQEIFKVLTLLWDEFASYHTSDCPISWLSRLDCDKDLSILETKYERAGRSIQNMCKIVEIIKTNKKEKEKKEREKLKQDFIRSFGNPLSVGRAAKLEKQYRGKR